MKISVDRLHSSLKMVALFVSFSCVALLFSPQLYAQTHAQTHAQPVLTDANGQPLPDNASEKVVSVGGSLTEIAYALGKEDALIAVDTTSVFPPRALTDKPNVGYMRALSAEGILALEPTLILAEDGAGPPDVIALLQEARVPFASIPARYDAQGIIDKIQLVGQALDAQKEARQLADQVRRDLDLLKSRISNIPPAEKKKVLFLFSLRGDRLMVSGKNSQASAIIEMAGGENVMTSFDGFKPVSNEAVLSADPDVILMMSRAGSPTASREQVLSHPAISATKAAQSGALVVMPGMYLLGFGPRTAYAIADLADHLYPDHSLGSSALFSRQKPGSAQ